jgi:putative hydrolase of the HAD superfamily
MRPRAVFFDLDDTLIDRASAFARYVADFIARYPTAFPRAHRADAVDTLHALDGRGYIDRVTFCRETTSAFPALGLTPEALWEDVSTRLPTFVLPSPPVSALVADVTARLPVAVVSNGSGRVQRAKLARAELSELLPSVFLSGEVGAEKPDPRIFAAALAHTGHAPADTLHVGDDPERDMVGASRLGIRTCWISGGRSWPAHLPSPTFTVTRVEDVAQVLA